MPRANTKVQKGCVPKLMPPSPGWCLAKPRLEVVHLAGAVSI
jgi:hypothetical protein